MKNHLNNPRETVYLLVFNKPRKTEEISEILYGSRNPRCNEYIKELIQQGWIKDNCEKDRRFKICTGTTKGFYDTIIASLAKENIFLNKAEKNKLKMFLDENLFRQIINEIYSDFSPGDDLRLFREIFSYGLIYSLSLYRYLQSLGVDMDDLIVFRSAIATALKEHREFNRAVLARHYLGSVLSEKLSHMESKKTGVVDGLFNEFVSHIERINKK